MSIIGCHLTCGPSTLTTAQDREATGSVRFVMEGMNVVVVHVARLQKPAPRPRINERCDLKEA